MIYRDIEKAQAEYDRAVEELEISRMIHEDVCEASLALREAECRMPFYSHRAAGAEHLVRMLKLREQTEDFVRVAMFGDPEVPDMILDTIDRYCKEAEHWLAEQ